MTPERAALEALIEDGPSMSADDFAVAALPLLMEADNEISRLHAEVERLTAESHVKVCGGKHAEAFLRDDSCPYCDADRLAEALREIAGLGISRPKPDWDNVVSADAVKLAKEALRQHEEQR